MSERLLEVAGENREKTGEDLGSRRTPLRVAAGDPLALG